MTGSARTEELRPSMALGPDSTEAGYRVEKVSTITLPQLLCGTTRRGQHDSRKDSLHADADMAIQHGCLDFLPFLLAWLCGQCAGYLERGMIPYTVNGKPLYVFFEGEEVEVIEPAPPPEPMPDIPPECHNTRPINPQLCIDAMRAMCR